MSDKPKVRIPSIEDTERTLYTETEIQQKVFKLGTRISEDYSDRMIHLVTILKGADTFANDLVRQIDLKIPLSRDYMILSHFEDEFAPSGKVNLSLDLKYGIKGRDVLVVEDIVDSGHTLNYLVNNLLLPREPSSVRVCSFLNKSTKRVKEFEHLKIDYLGFNVEDAFVVGYGLDYKQYCRNWPFIAVLKEEFYQTK